MHQALFASRLELALVAAVIGIIYIRPVADRDGRWWSVRRGSGMVALLIACLVAFGWLSMTLAYSILCCGLACAFVIDAVHREGAQRRRVASLSRRPVIDVVPLVWICITVLSTLPLLPYVIGRMNVGVTLLAGACAIAMAAIAWRMATAPLQLDTADAATNPNVQLVGERADRARRTGVLCVVAIGTIAFYLNVVDAIPPAVAGLERTTDLEMLLIAAVVYVWQALYVRRLASSADRVST